MPKKQFNPVTACKRPSDLIKLALKDLAKAEKSPKHRVNMDTWHTFDLDGRKPKCAVCFAGGTMAFSFGLPPTQTATPFDTLGGVSLFDRETSSRLSALNIVRAGYVTDFLEEFYKNSAPGKVVAAHKKAAKAFADGDDMLYYSPDITVKVPPYSRRSPKFKKAMLSIAKRLEKVGL